MNDAALWQKHQRYLSGVPALGLTLDVSRMNFDEAFLAKLAPSMTKAFDAMDALEKGAIANPDENRMVGHYWLRAPELSPTPEIAAEIRKTVADVKAFAAGVHGGKVRPHPRFLVDLEVHQPEQWDRGSAGAFDGDTDVADVAGDDRHHARRAARVLPDDLPGDRETAALRNPPLRPRVPAL